MKKRIAAFFCAAALLFGTACQKEKMPELLHPVQFFYKTAETTFEGEYGVIAPEQREANGHEEDLQWLLEAYFAGPQGDTLVAPFRSETTLTDCSLEDGVLSVTVSSHLAELGGVDLTVACACIAMTCLEFADVDSVQISAENTLLEGRSAIVITRSDIALMDRGMESNSRVFQLYFTDEARRYLLPEETVVTESEISEICRVLVQRLIDGSQEDHKVSPLPSKTRVLGVSVQGGICSVNFSAEFSKNVFRDEIAQRTALLSVIDTLTQLEQVDAVEFYEEGNLLVSYGFMDLSTVWSRDESVIGPVRTSVNEFEADLCVGIGSQSFLARVPVKLRQSANESPAALALGALLNWQPGNGFVRLVPEGTSVRSVTMENGLCTVDFTKDFLDCDNLEAQNLAIRCVVGTLCSLPEVERVRILVEGGVPEGNLGALFDTQVSSDHWFF